MAERIARVSEANFDGISEEEFDRQAKIKSKGWNHLQPGEDAKEITINWMDPDGNLTAGKHKVGTNLLKAAQEMDMDLPALCDGAGGEERDYDEGPQCKFCHVYIASAYLPLVNKRFPTTTNENHTMYWIDNTTANSRMACVIDLEEGMDGMTVAIPQFNDFDYGDPVFNMNMEARYLRPEDQEVEEEIEFQEKQERLMEDEDMGEQTPLVFPEESDRHKPRLDQASL